MQAPSSQRSPNEWMDRALALARRAEGRTSPNPPVGAVLVQDGVLVGEGFHPEAGKPHAEIYALREAGNRARGADLYVTLEPCSHRGKTGPCAEALLQAGVGRVFVGTADPNPVVSGTGIERLRQAGIDVEVGIEQERCRELIAPFARHVVTGMPLVTLKAAMTLDGRTATAQGDSKWISSEESRREVHRLRDRVDAILVGIGTVLADDPRLTARLDVGVGRDPLRVVVDTHLRIPSDARLLNQESEAATLIFCGADVPEHRAERIRRPKVEVIRLSEGQNRIDLRAMLKVLGDRGVQSLLLEGGAMLNQAMLEAELIDRIRLYLAPQILGGRDGIGLFGGFGPEHIAGARPVRGLSTRFVDGDLVLEGELRPCLPGW